MPTKDPTQLSLFNLNDFFVSRNPDSKTAEIRKKAAQAGETLQKYTDDLRKNESELKRLEEEMVDHDQNDSKQFK